MVKELHRLTRVAELARRLNVNQKKIVEMCEKHGIEIIRAGKCNIKYVSGDKFFKAIGRSEHL